MFFTHIATINSYLAWRTASILAVVASLVLLHEYLPVVGLAFFFVGPCNDSCSSDDSSCSSGGSTDGGDGGSDGGGTDGADCVGCNSGCDSVGCDPGDCTSSSGDGAVGSTPYLYVKKDGVYEMQNDVMVGYPVTAVMGRAEGEEKHRLKMLGNDIYPLPLSDVDRDDRARVSLRLKEIEAEESFIYRLRTHAYRVPEGHCVMPSWDHIKLISYDPAALQHVQGKVWLNGTTDCTASLNTKKQDSPKSERQHSLRLSRGDVLTFTAPKSAGNRLVVSSFWRDWMVGDLADDIHGLGQKQAAVLSPFAATARVLKRAAAKTAVFATVLAGAFLGQANTQSATEQSAKQDDLLAFIKKCNSVNVARADTPHSSLHVSYKHPDHGAWIHIATIQPRAYLPVEEYIVIRDTAYDQNGKAEIRIEATKGHYVKSLSLMPSDSVRELAPLQSAGVQAVHYRGEEQLADIDTDGGQDRAEPIHLIAGDVLDITTSEVPSEANYLSVELHGFYMPLSPEGRERAGDWNARLDTRERELVASMYA